MLGKTQEYIMKFKNIVLLSVKKKLKLESPNCGECLAQVTEQVLRAPRTSGKSVSTHTSIFQIHKTETLRLLFKILIKIPEVPESMES